MADRPVRVVLAKTSLDGHDRGVKVLARLLRDAGMEVVYLGMHQRPEGVARGCVEEDADVVGLSFLSGEHLTHTPPMVDALKEAGLFGRIVFVVGGILPLQDVAAIKAMGADEVFLGGTPAEEIVSYIRRAVAARRPDDGLTPGAARGGPAPPPPASPADTGSPD